MITRMHAPLRSRIIRGWRAQRGGVALIVLLSFLALAVPVATASTQFAGQLARNSQVFEGRFFGGDAARAGIQAALHELRTSSDPVDTLALSVNGVSVNVSLVEGTTTTDLSPFAYADVVLSIDVSSSVTSSELVQLKQAANDIIDAFELHTTSKRMRIGVNRFRGSYESVVPMSNVDAEQTDPTSLHFSGISLHDGINGLLQGGPGLDPGTSMLAAINGGVAQFSTGLGDRPEIPNLLIVITDGDDSVGNSGFDIRAAEEASGAEVFAVGVGTEHDIKENTLNDVSGEPNADHVFRATDYADLINIIDAIVASANKYALIGTLYDIESIAADGSTIQVRALVSPDGTVTVLSWTES